MCEFCDLSDDYRVVNKRLKSNPFHSRNEALELYMVRWNPDLKNARKGEKPFMTLEAQVKGLEGEFKGIALEAVSVKIQYCPFCGEKL